MKVTVNYDLCESNAICVDACPEVFSINENDKLIVSTGKPDEALRDKVQRAVANCPRQALSLVDD